MEVAGLHIATPPAPRLRWTPWVLLPGLLLATTLAACADAPTPRPPTVLPEPAGALTADQKRRAEQLTSVFENDTIDLQYAYAEILDDGRGITAGRAGFTTATGDALLVVQRYMAQVPANPLARFLPALVRLAAAGSADTASLPGFVEAWATAARDPVFRGVQDAVVDELYYRPTLGYAAALGVQTALGKAVLYDTLIQHGADTDADGLPALVARTNAALGGSPRTGVTEPHWVRGFLTTRRADLAHAADPATRTAWAQSVGRCDVWRDLAAADNWDLQGPIVVDTPAHQATIP